MKNIILAMGIIMCGSGSSLHPMELTPIDRVCANLSENNEIILPRVIKQEEIDNWFQAIERGNVSLVRELMVKQLLINICNDRGLTGLMVAIKNANADVALLLMRAGADVHAEVVYENRYKGFNVLCFAIGREGERNMRGTYFVSSVVIRELLARGVKPNVHFSTSFQTATRWNAVINWQGKTALMFFVAHVPYTCGWDVIAICDLLCKEAPQNEIEFAFKMACHVNPNDCSLEKAYAQGRLQQGRSGGVNPLVFEYFVEKLGLSRSDVVII